MPECPAKPLILAIVGATATGKSAIALELADGLNAEIVSVDSVQVYRGMDIGSDKPSQANQGRVRHHMIDIIDSDEEIDVQMFRCRANEAIAGILSRRKIPLLVGGSALYFTALTAPVEFKPTDPELRSEIESMFETQGLDAVVTELQRLDPQTAGTIDLRNPRRVVRALESAILMTDGTLNAGEPSTSAPLPGRRATPRLGTGPAALAETMAHDFPVNLVGLALTVAPAEHSQRIRDRVTSMFDRGLEAEVREVFGIKGGTSQQQTSPPSRTARQALGYKEVASALYKGQSGESAIEAIVSRTRQLSRRQTAWFRRDARLSWISTSRISRSGLLESAHSYFNLRLGSVRRERLA